MSERTWYLSDSKPLEAVLQGYIEGRLRYYRSLPGWQKVWDIWDIGFPEAIGAPVPETALGTDTHGISTCRPRFPNNISSFSNFKPEPYIPPEPSIEV